MIADLIRRAEATARTGQPNLSMLYMRRALVLVEVERRVNRAEKLPRVFRLLDAAYRVTTCRIQSFRAAWTDIK